MEPAISLRSAVVLLGGFPALAGLDLDVHDGELLLVRGANGAGKTSLLRACAGLTRLARGGGQVLGFDLGAQRAAIRGAVGFLAHEVGLYDELTLGDNLRFWTGPLGVTEPELRAAADQVGVGGALWDVRAAGLSAGQRRRTGLALLIARRPRVWLLDEPHAGLDHDGRDLVDELMRSAIASGATVMVSTHDLDRVAAIADRSVEIVAGTAIDDPAVPR